MSAGTETSCATERGGSVWCWGLNDSGQLGNDTPAYSAVPIRVSGLDNALTVTTGGTWHSGGKGASLFAFACALLRDGTVHCWGRNGASLLGTASVAYSSVPLPIPGLKDAIAVAAGDEHACALASGSVLCWGAGSLGQLGSGVPATCSGAGCSPTAITHVLDGATAIAGQGSDFSCAVLTDASVRCWGSVTGASGADAIVGSPTTVAGVTATSRGLAVGFHHACAIAPVDDSIRCWGTNDDGELGDGTKTASSAPVAVRGLAGPAVAVTAGLAHTCAVLTDGRVQCWGHNAWGQLGDGTFKDSLVPVTVSDLADATAASAGYVHTCALTRAGSIRCWGENGGTLGNGDTSMGGVPTPVTVLGF